MTTDKQILELFVDQDIMQRSQVDDILGESAQSGKTILQVMVDYEIVTEEGYYQAIANSIGADYVNLADYEVPWRSSG